MSAPGRSQARSLKHAVRKGNPMRAPGRSQARIPQHAVRRVVQ